jgi:hypothetical protein
VPKNGIASIMTSLSNKLPAVSNCNVPSNQFCSEYYSNRTLSGGPTFIQNTGSINSNWGNGGPGNGVGNDNFSARWQGSFSFENATYSFTATADDGIRLYVDGGLQIDAWRDQGATTYKKDIALSAGNHTIKVEYYENGGGAIAQTSWAKKAPASSGNLALGKAASATSNQSSAYTPGLAVDGNNSTRWSSGQNSSLGPQWWIVDLGSSQSINQIVIRWEAAYARDYFVGYSNATNCWSTSYSGWNYYPWSAETKTVSFSTVTARCVGIYMRTRASGMSNYSIYEVEVYRK